MHFSNKSFSEGYMMGKTFKPEDYDGGIFVLYLKYMFLIPSSLAIPALIFSYLSDWFLHYWTSVWMIHLVLVVILSWFLINAGHYISKHPAYDLNLFAYPFIFLQVFLGYTISVVLLPFESLHSFATSLLNVMDDDPNRLDNALIYGFSFIAIYTFIHIIQALIVPLLHFIFARILSDWLVSTKMQIQIDKFVVRHFYPKK
ncbi:MULTISPECIES: hypothetical protein [unclassified Psychrobacillus]|uniref:hypothetical protein n=1 Tax=unclassified Psychrobacillus TaxID=2636677 RepID=UPI0030FAC6C5